MLMVDNKTYYELGTFSFHSPNGEYQEFPLWETLAPAGKTRRIPGSPSDTQQFFAPYTFVPISEKTGIRLLRISGRNAASSGIDHEHPLCEIVELDLDLDAGKTEYEALSYAWGDLRAEESHDFLFFVGTPQKKFIKVTDSLFTAIRRLQRAEEDRYLWVDQVCINQHDLEERKQQVGLMPRIFREARRTVVWLGEDTDSACQTFSRMFQGLNGTASPPDCPESWNNVDDPGWEVMLGFFAKPWFGRLWVIQEVTLSVGATVLCGSVEYSLEDVIKMGDMIHARGVLRGVNEGIIAMHLMRSYRHMYQTYNSILPLSYLLGDTFCLFKCSNPRDKVFALLNMAMDVNDDFKACLIDYEASVEEIYILTAHFMAYSISNLQFLSWICPMPLADREVLPRMTRNSLYREGLTSLPSWVPDWTFNSPFTGIEKYTVLNDWNTDGLLPNFDPTKSTLFNASRGRLHRYSSLEDSNLLAVMGKIIARVTHLVQYDFSPPDLLLEHKGIPFDDIAEALVQQLGIEWTSDLAPPDDSASLQIIKRLVVKTLCAVGSQSTFEPGTLEDPDELDRVAGIIQMDTIPNRTLSQQIPDFNFEQFERNCKSIFPLFNVAYMRRLAVLDNFPLALVPKAARSSDVLAILHGSSVPILLRETGDQYIVIGQCFVDGVMYGEAFDWEEDDAETFILQ